MTPQELSILEEYLRLSHLDEHLGKCPECEADIGEGYTHFDDCKALMAYQRIVALVNAERSRLAGALNT